MADLKDLEKRAADYHRCHSSIGSLLEIMNEEIEKVRGNYLPDILFQAKEMGKIHKALKRSIESNPDLFKKPKTVVLHGVKVGIKKGKGKLELKYSEKKTMELIESLFPGEAFEGLELIQASYSLRKTALARMKAGDLKRLGVTVEDAGDEVVVKVTDSEGAKLVQAFLKEAGIKEG